MIKLGTEQELFKIKHLPINIQTAISEDVRIVDENYGKNRNIVTAEYWWKYDIDFY